jgi:ABC-type transporter Mla MlaB component
MLKISQAGKANHSVTLKLEGRVVGPWVGELRQVCETLLTEGRTLKLDLTDVTLADADGVAVDWLQNARRDSEKLLAVCGRTIEVNSE